jgi:ribosomal protein S6
MKLYEGMFLLDNQAVRENWGRAKATITDILAKHGAKVVTARHWDERKLAYPIKGRTRGTYLLAFFECGNEGVNQMRRDFEIDDRVLRYLLVNAEALPAGELEKSQAESAAEFTLPTPPVEERVTAERAVFGELADRPVVDRSRAAPPAPEEGDAAEGEESEIEAPAVGEGV